MKTYPSHFSGKSSADAVVKKTLKEVKWWLSKSTNWYKWNERRGTTGWESRPLCNKLRVWPYWHIVYTQVKSLKRKCIKYLGLLDANKSLDFNLKTRIKVNLEQKKMPLYLADFGISADHRIKIKESKNIDKYLDLGIERKKNFGT